jgi:hypothetical protein
VHGRPKLETIQDGGGGIFLVDEADPASGKLDATEFQGEGLSRARILILGSLGRLGGKISEVGSPVCGHSEIRFRALEDEAADPDFLPEEGEEVYLELYGFNPGQHRGKTGGVGHGYVLKAHPQWKEPHLCTPDLNLTGQCSLHSGLETGSQSFRIQESAENEEKSQVDDSGQADGKEGPAEPAGAVRIPW